MVAPVAPAPVTNGKIAPTKVEAPKPAPVTPIDDTEEYPIDGKLVRLTKAQRQMHIQKGAASDRRFEEAKALRQKIDEREKLLETDFEAYLRSVGKDPEALMAALLEKKAKAAQLTPEQRRIEELEAKSAAAEEKAAKFESEQKAARQAELDQRNFKALEAQLIAVADASGLEQSPYVLQSMCDIALEYLEHEIILTPEQVAAEFQRRDRESTETSGKKLLGVLTGAKLLAFLGPDVVAKVKAAFAEADAASLKTLQTPQAKRTQVKAHERIVKNAHMTENDFNKKFGI